MQDEKITLTRKDADTMIEYFENQLNQAKLTIDYNMLEKLRKHAEIEGGAVLEEVNKTMSKITNLLNFYESSIKVLTNGSFN